MHRNSVRQPRTQVLRQLELVAGPPAGADERGGDEDDRRETPSGWVLGEKINENRPADRMANDDRAVVKHSELLLDRSAQRS
jgi:hypothetical protein